MKLRRLPWRVGVGVLLGGMLGMASASDPFEIPAETPPRVIGPAYFGTHFHRLGHAEPDHLATAWPVGLVGSLRLWDSTTRWADVEPAPGRFDFARLDEQVEQARAQGAGVLLVLGSPPRWASARPQEPGPYGPGSASEPAYPALWDRYVHAVARRYKGRISQYEVWNEPYFSDLPQDRDQPGAFFTGSVSTMVDLARRARAAIAVEDPQARLLTPGFVGSPHRLDMFLAAGGGAYVDAVAFHFYVDGDDEGFVTQAAAVRAVMARHGLGRMALVNTESGFAIQGVEGQAPVPGQPPIDRRTAAALLARSMILGAWLGLDRFYQYAWDNDRMGMLMPDGRTTDSLPAYGAVRRWLLGTTLLGCRSASAHVVRCEGQRGDQHVFVAWQRTKGVVETFTLPDGVTAVSLDPVLPARAAGVPAGQRVFALPQDGMPVAVWTKASLQPSHTDVMRDR